MKYRNLQGLVSYAKGGKMKKFAILMLALVLTFSMTGCSKVADKIGKKIEEKAEEKLGEVIEKVGDEEGTVDDEESDEEDGEEDGNLIKKIFSGDDEDDKEESKKEDKKDKKAKKDKKDKKSKKSKKGKKAKKNKKSDKKEFDFEACIDEADLSLKGRDLLLELEPMFKNMISDDGPSVHMNLYQYDVDDDLEMYMDFYKDGDNMYMDYDAVDKDEDDMLTVINADENKTYMVMGDGTGYEIPFDPSSIGGDDASMNFAFTDEDLSNVLDAYVEEFEGEDCVYVQTQEGEDIGNAWFSLERYCPVYQEMVDEDDNVLNSSEMLEFERGGDYSDMFEKPEDVEWLSMGDMFSDVVEKLEESDE